MDRILGLAILALATIYLTAASQLPSVALGDPLGPRVFPVMIGLLLIIPGAALLLSRGDRGPKVMPANMDEEDGADPVADRLHPAIAISVVIGLMAAYYSTLERFGYIATTPVFMFAVLYVMYGRRHLVNAVTAVAFTTATYWAFYWLGITLPRSF